MEARGCNGGAVFGCLLVEGRNNCSVQEVNLKQMEQGQIWTSIAAQTSINKLHEHEREAREARHQVSNLLPYNYKSSAPGNDCLPA